MSRIWKEENMVRQKKIAVGIVLYNPKNLERFYECLSSISKQSSNIYIFDNSTKKSDIDLPDHVIYMTDGCNVGIAYALNRIFERAQKDGFEWVVTMDQDSILPNGLLDAYEREIENNKKIAIVCPQVIDVRRNYMLIKSEPEKEYVHKCITSGSCTSIDIWSEVGEFDEWLFIDLVDNEFCKRVVSTGYLIKRLNKYILNQEFGEIVPKKEKKQKFWLKVSNILHNVNFAKLSYKKKVSPARVYYTNRNIIYVNRKMKMYGKVGYDSYNCKNYIGFIISFILPSIIRADEKRKVLKATIHGINDGIKKTVKVWKV